MYLAGIRDTGGLPGCPRRQQGVSYQTIHIDSLTSPVIDSREILQREG